MTRRITPMQARMALVVGMAFFLLGLTSAMASADTVQIRNPLDTPSEITSDWNHPDFADPIYYERSIDSVYDQWRTTAGGNVSSRVDNLNAGERIYYDSFDYGSASCNGVKHVMYENVPGSSYYDHIGTVVYVHLVGHTTSWYSVSIPPSSSESRTIGWVANGDCGTLPHLHHGRESVSTNEFNYAAWLTSSVRPRPYYDVTSSDITLYK